MRRSLVIALCVVAAVGLMATAIAAQSIPLVTSPNVSVVTTVPDVSAISGSFSQVSPHYYLSTLGGVRVYDVSDPEAPQLTGVVPIGQFENEAMYSAARNNTDGTVTELVLVGNDLAAAEAPTGVSRGYDPTDAVNSFPGSELLVIDVSDPTDPFIRSRTPTESGTHTVACMDPACMTVYTSGSGDGYSILDLTDLDAPVEVAGPTEAATHPSPSASGHYWDLDPSGLAWHTGFGGTAAFDIADPGNPVLLNSTNELGTEGPWNNFIHHNSAFPGASQFVETDSIDQASWANGNVLLVTEEDYENPTCDSASVSGGEGPGEGSFEIWYVPSLDAGDNPDGATDNGSIQPLSLYNTETLSGTVDNPLGGFCSAHWFNFHPTGVIAQGWYQEGMRLIDVRDPAAPVEFGYFYPGGSEIWDADWVPVYDDDGLATGDLSDLLYTNDLVRGIDVLDVDLPEDDIIQPTPPEAGGVPDNNPVDPDGPSREEPQEPEEQPSEPGSDDGSSRIEGPTRIETAVAGSQQTNPDSADTVVIARSDEYADALVGGPLATSIDAPLLLTTPEGLHPATAREIERLGATTAIVLGDLPAPAQDLADDGLTVDQINGETVFATAALVADRLPGDTAFVAEGASDDPARGWPDALAASVAGSIQTTPILLVEADELPDATATALEERDAAVVVGGDVAVRPAVKAQIEQIVDTVEVVAGRTRYETALAMASRLETSSDSTAAATVFATGLDWPDALVAGPVTASADGLMMLVDGSTLDGSPPTVTYVEDRSDTIAELVFMGGVDAISARVQEDVEALLE